LILFEEATVLLALASKGVSVDRAEQVARAVLEATDVGPRPAT
jgi:hypothetical protein